MMKILYHHRTQGRSVEGVHIWSIVKSLKTLGHSVDVISLLGKEVSPPCDQGGILNQSTKKEAGKKYSVIRKFAGWVSRYAPELVFEILELAYNLIVCLRVASYSRDNKPDLVYERYALFMFATVWFCRKKRIPIILEVNDSAVVERVRPLFLNNIAIFIESWVFRNCSGIVFISDEFFGIGKKYYGSIAPSIISPNAADISIFSPKLYDREKKRFELGLQDSVVCGYVGAFVEWHGIGWFIKEISGLIAGQKNIVLLLVGDGHLFPEITKFVADNNLQDQVKLTGRVNHADVPSLISAMDFAVLPDSNIYGSPMKLFEHMAMGVAMVAPDYGPIKEVIKNDVTGWLFKRSDKAACVEKVMQVAQDLIAQKKIGSAARTHIVEHHQWENNANQLLKLYEDVKYTNQK